MRNPETSKLSIASAGVTTGLGSGVDSIINANPLISSDISKFMNGPGRWKFRYTSPGMPYNGSVTVFADLHTVFIDKRYEGNPHVATGQLLHELGHVALGQGPDVTKVSKGDYVRAMLANEASAQVTAMRYAQTLGGEGLQVHLPGSQATLTQEMHAYLSILAQVQSGNMQMPQAMGILQTQFANYMGHDRLANGQSYIEYYEQFWNDNSSFPANGGNSTGASTQHGVGGSPTWGVGGAAHRLPAGWVLFPWSPLVNPTVSVGKIRN